QLYKHIVYESIEFVKRELLNPTGGFYSALDADSEGVEGKYYVWKKEELQKLLPQYYHVFADYYNVNHLGYWEEDNYILMRQDEDSVIADRHHISVAELSDIIQQSKLILLEHRNKRVKPGLDYKIITSWNALIIKALCEAYLVFDEDSFKQLAVSNTDYLYTHCLRQDASLLHLASASKIISGFLEDYAFTIEAFMQVYLITANQSYLYQAKRMCDYAIQHFYDDATQTFFFTDASKEKLIVRKAEWSDNVIPASSSQMALNLYQLSIYFNESSYLQISKNLLNKVIKEIVHYGAGYSNWSILLLWITQASTEIVITGDESLSYLKSIYKQAPPHVVFAISTTESDVPLLKNRYNKTQTQVYVCKNKACQLPTTHIDEVFFNLN
ncbi:MAG: thioredoxin domain-containing protein, partial [Bacteroidia bacterium]|nr:thioredoxin domain-containing protein [Bacteroidia bacterium]